MSQHDPKDLKKEEPSQGAAEEKIESVGAVGAEDGGADDILVGDLEDVREQLRLSEEKVLRLAADFDNTRKRLEREKGSLLKYAEENILRELLPGIDNLERALEQGRDVPEAAGFFEGVELTLKGFLGTLEKFGVKPIESIGKSFDPNIHEALAMEESSDSPANTVLKEFQKGYYYKDRLLRATKVIVASNTSGNAGKEAAPE